MAVGDINPVYANTVSGNAGTEGLASSSDFTAGWEIIVVDVGAMSPIPRDVRHQGKFRVGTNPVANTEIRLYLIASEDGATWPDVFDGTAGNAETITDGGVRDGFAKRAATIRVLTTTTGRDYWYDFSALEKFGGSLPDNYSLWLTHNTGVNSEGTAGNHTYMYRPQYDKATLS